MLDIVTLPTPTLRERSKELDRDVLLSDKMQALIENMFPTMHGADGIGLAAPQVGENIRIFTIGKDAIPRRHEIWDQLGQAHGDIAIINPEWQRLSKKTDVEVEGCLSVPGKIGRVKRYKDIRVSAWSQDGKELQFDAHNYFARVIQHEVDHLNGVLFIDKATHVEETAAQQNI